MKGRRSLLIACGVAVLCLAYASLLSADEAHASPPDGTARSFALAPPAAIPVQGGCGGSITYDQPVRGLIEPGRELCFEFRGDPGDVITARMTRLDDNLDPLLKLWGANGTLTQDDDSGGDRNSLIDRFTLPQSGGYALLASGYGMSSGYFELFLTRVAASPIPQPTPQAAPPCGGVIDYGTSVEEHLVPGDRCEYHFSGQQGDLVTIVLEELEGQLDPWLDLIDPQGRVEVFDDDSGAEHNSQISYHTLLHSGLYTIAARSYQDRGSGPYRLTLFKGPCYACGGYDSVPPLQACGDSMEYGRQHDGIISTDVLTCTYSFEGSRQDLVTLRLDTVFGNLDPVIYLYAPSDNLHPVATNDDAYGSNSLLWRLRLTENGTYRAVARAFLDQSTGTFRILLTEGLFRRGDQVQIICTGAVDIRGTPGDVRKPSGDVLASVPRATVLTVTGGSRVIGGRKWWQVEYRNQAGMLVTGWMPDAAKDGGVILVPAFLP